MTRHGRRTRSGPEWVTFSVSVVVLAVVVALLAVGLGDGDDPADPVATVLDGQITARRGGFQVPVEVHNDGGRAAAGVQVTAELVGPGGTEVGDQSVDFLGAGETVRVVFVFGEDPAGGELTVAVAGFTVP